MSRLTDCGGRACARALAALLCLCGFAGSASALTVYAAGDVADCRHSPALGNGAAATEKLIPSGAIVLMLGDAAYPHADRDTLVSCYGPTWGRHREETLAVLGNHDVGAGIEAGFLDYFPGPGGRDGNGHHYRVALGDWWFIGLDSNLRGAALEEQFLWLRATLKSIDGDGRCVAAAWHHPLLSTGLHSGDGERMRETWTALAEAGADIVLNGHEHFYEAYAPRDATARGASEGIREFVVGTGGAALGDFSLAPWEHRAFARTHGVLALDLEPDRYAWRFITADGRTLDQGQARCRRSQSR